MAVRTPGDQWTTGSPSGAGSPAAAARSRNPGAATPPRGRVVSSVRPVSRSALWDGGSESAASRRAPRGRSGTTPAVDPGGPTPPVRRRRGWRFFAIPILAVLSVVLIVDIVHVPFKGGGPAMIDVIGGHSQLLVSSLIQTVPHVRSGKLKALATGGAQLHSKFTTPFSRRGFTQHKEHILGPARTACNRFDISFICLKTSTPLLFFTVLYMLYRTASLITLPFNEIRYIHPIAFRSLWHS